MRRSVALFALLVMGPVLVGLATVLLICQGKPVLFRQTRLGLGQREFSLVKFRTMRINDRDPHTMGTVSFEHPMVTPVGRWFRRFRLDEMPQLINIASGDMSLVGPRPCLPGQQSQMSEKQLKRFEVRPGLTGLAEVSGNVLLSHEEQWNLDWRYVVGRDSRLNCRIILKTVSVVVFGPRRDDELISETYGLLGLSHD